MNSIDDFEGLWRAASNNAVKYSDDFPECFLLLPELVDGSIAQGNCTKIQIQININGELGELKVIDNGKGVTNTNRLLSWVSKESASVHNRYGTGSKLCLTKWNNNYNAKWYVRYRTRDKKNNSGSLFTYHGPFSGPSKDPEEDEHNDEILMPSGLEWCIEFNTSIFGDIQKPKKIFNTIKEILTTRYSKFHFDKTDFILEIITSDATIRQSSKEHNWKSFYEIMNEEVSKGNCVQMFTDIQQFNDIQMHCSSYILKEDKNVEKLFPFYGRRKMTASRLHISLDGRTIEIAPFWQFTYRKTNHNDLNGYIGFVNFIVPDKNEYKKAPTPATIKVSFYEGCPIYKDFVDTIRKLDIGKKEPDLPKPDPPKPDPPKPDPPKPDPPKSKIKENKEITIKYNNPEVYYTIIYMNISNWNEFDNIYIYCIENNKEYKIDKDLIKINNLDPDKSYTFEIKAIKDNKEYTHIFEQIIPNVKICPLCPHISDIKDETHDIQINFLEPKDIGIPITHVKICKDNKVLETIPFKQKIKLSQKIHTETKIKISYINEIGESNKLSQKIKQERCSREDFPSSLKKKVLRTTGYKCNITGVRFDIYNRPEFDHKNGLSCDINESNCQPLLVEIHSIKSCDKKSYDLLRDNKEELLNYKINKINNFLDSLNDDERNKLKFTNNRFEI